MRYTYFHSFYNILINNLSHCIDKSTVMYETPTWRQLSIAVATQFAAFSTGGSMGYPGVLLYQLKKKDSNIPLDLDSASWIGSIHGLAGIPGVAAPVVMQWKGRKFTFIAACIILIIGWVLTFVANGIAIILLGEMLHGLGANVLLTVCYDCLSEMITPAYRNVAVQSYAVVQGLGIATAGVMTKFLHWRMQSVILCLPAVVGVLISCTWLESPLWLACKGDLDTFKINFTKLRGTDEHSVKELQEVVSAHMEKLSRNDASKGDGVIKRFMQQVTSRDFVVPTLHVLLLLNHCYWSGCVVILIYPIELISKTTKNETAAFIGGIIINVIFVIGTALSCILIRIYNNKPVLLISTCGATVCLVCVSIVTYLQEVGTVPEESLLTLYFLIGFMITSSLGQIPVVFTMSAELIPVKHRGLGGVFFVIFACSLYASSLKISPYLFMYLGLWETFLIYTLNSLVCGLLIWKHVPVTKGKTLQQIENFYENGTFEIKLLSNEEAELIDVKNL